jgi:hypothetical protein
MLQGKAGLAERTVSTKDAQPVSAGRLAFHLQ